MPRYVNASDEHRIETSQDMDPRRPGERIMPGFARAHLTIYEPGEECSDTLPTVGDLLSKHIDERTGLISLRGLTRLDLSIDPALLREFPLNSRVGPGYSFVTHEALERAGGRPPRDSQPPG